MSTKYRPAMGLALVLGLLGVVGVVGSLFWLVLWGMRGIE